MREAIRASAVIGTFGCADVGGPFPGVLALGGSSGGIPENILDMLIPAGFASLGLAYFAGPTAPDLTHEGLPADLVAIPLERIERGLRWLIQHPNVTTPDGRVGLIGVSKGGELALLVAATFPEFVGPVVAYTPSSVVWQGVTWSAVGQQARQALSSWTFRGEPLPFVPYPVGVAGTTSARGLADLRQGARRHTSRRASGHTDRACNGTDPGHLGKRRSDVACRADVLDGGRPNAALRPGRTHHASQLSRRRAQAIPVGSGSGRRSPWTTSRFRRRRQSRGGHRGRHRRATADHRPPSWERVEADTVRQTNGHERVPRDPEVAVGAREAIGPRFQLGSRERLRLAGDGRTRRICLGQPADERSDGRLRAHARISIRAPAKRDS
jgi:hypothetical protein